MAAEQTSEVSGLVGHAPEREVVKDRLGVGPRRLRELQRTAGNRALSLMLQPKLTVGPAGDRWEREADMTAGAVMRYLKLNASGAAVDDASRGAELPLARSIQAKPASATIGLEGGDVDADTDAAIRQQTGRGAPLDDTVRNSMEAGFGADFSGVRVHDDATSDDLNQRIQAKAFTTGSDIFFAKGQYNPASSSGQELLAHELTHTVQQGSSGVHRDVVRRASGLPTKAELKAEGLKAGWTFMGQSSWADLLDGLDEYANDVGDDDFSPMLEKLKEISKLIDAWSGSTSRAKVKKGDDAKSQKLEALKPRVQELIDYANLGLAMAQDLIPFRDVLIALGNDKPAFDRFMGTVGVTAKDQDLEGEQISQRQGLEKLAFMDLFFSQPAKYRPILTELNPTMLVLFEACAKLVGWYSAGYKASDTVGQVDTSTPKAYGPFKDLLTELTADPLQGQPVSGAEIGRLWEAFIAQKWTYVSNAGTRAYDLVLGRSTTANCGALSGGLIELVRIVATARGVAVPAMKKVSINKGNPFITVPIPVYCDDRFVGGKTNVFVRNGDALDALPGRAIYDSHTWAVINNEVYDPTTELRRAGKAADLTKVGAALEGVVDGTKYSFVDHETFAKANKTVAEVPYTTDGLATYIATVIPG